MAFSAVSLGVASKWEASAGRAPCGGAEGWRRESEGSANAQDGTAPDRGGSDIFGAHARWSLSEVTKEGIVSGTA